MDNLLQAYASVPPITRFYITTCCAISILSNFGIISDFQLYLNWRLVFEHHEFWRLYTNFCYLGTSPLSIILHVFFSFRYVHILEQEHFAGRRADCLIMYMFCMTTLLGIGWYTGAIFLTRALMSSFVYIWSKKNPSVNASLLPWVILMLSMLLGSDTRIVVGHLYYYLTHVAPEHGLDVLKAPHWLKVYVSDIEPIAPAEAQTDENGQEQDAAAA